MRARAKTRPTLKAIAAYSPTPWLWGLVAALAISACQHVQWTDRYRGVDVEAWKPCKDARLGAEVRRGIDYLYDRIPEDEWPEHVFLYGLDKSWAHCQSFYVSPEWAYGCLGRFSDDQGRNQVIVRCDRTENGALPVWKVVAHWLFHGWLTRHGAEAVSKPNKFHEDLRWFDYGMQCWEDPRILEALGVGYSCELPQ